MMRQPEHRHVDDSGDLQQLDDVVRDRERARREAGVKPDPADRHGPIGCRKYTPMK